MLKLKFAHNKQSSKQTTLRIVFRLSNAVFVEICEFVDLQFADFYKKCLPTSTFSDLQSRLALK
jgi:hypothetical protein